MTTKRLTLDALLCAIALTIFIVELQIPSLVPIPGVKLGLANIITVVAIISLSRKDAAFILFVRILLGAFISGNMMALMYSLAGGLLCFLAMCILSLFVNENQIFICSIIGAIFHNIGQIIVAILITRTSAMLYYLPILMISSIITGLFTGLCAQFVCKRLKHIIR